MATTKKKTGSKKPARRSAKRTTTPTITELAESYLAHLEAAGKTNSTIAGYRADLGIAARHFGADTRIGSISAKQIETFNKSAAVTKTRAGKAKAKPGVERIRRVLRLALCWAEAEGLIKTAPLPKAKS